MGIPSDVSADDTARLQIQHASIRGPTHEITPQEMQSLLKYVSKERLLCPPKHPTQASADLLVEGDTIIFDPKAEDPLGLRGCEIQIPSDAADRLTFAFGGQPVLVGGPDNDVSDLPIIGFSVPNGPQYNALAKYGVSLPGVAPTASHNRQFRLGRTQAVTVDPTTARTPKHTHTTAEIEHTEIKQAPQLSQEEVSYITPEAGLRAQDEYYKFYEQEYRAQRHELRQRRKKRGKRETKLEARPGAAACGLEPPAVGSLMGAALQATHNWFTNMTGTRKDLPDRKSSHDERKRRVLEAARSGSQTQSMTKKPIERSRRDPSVARRNARSPQIKLSRRRSASRVPARQTMSSADATPTTLTPRTRGPPPGAAVLAAYDATQEVTSTRPVASPVGNYMLQQKNLGRGVSPVKANLVLHRPPQLMRSQTDSYPSRPPTASPTSSYDDHDKRVPQASAPLEITVTPRTTPQAPQSSEAFMAAERDFMVHLLGRQVAAQQLRETIDRTTAELGLKRAPPTSAILNMNSFDPSALVSQVLSQARTQMELEQQSQQQLQMQHQSQQGQLQQHSQMQQQAHPQMQQQSPSRTQLLSQEPPQLQQDSQMHQQSQIQQHQGSQMQHHQGLQMQPQSQIRTLGAVPTLQSASRDEAGKSGERHGVAGEQSDEHSETLGQDETESLCDRGFVEAGRDSTHRIMRLQAPETSIRYRVKNPATGESREVEVVSVCNKPRIELVRHLLSETEARELEELLEDIQSLPHLPQNLLDNDALEEDDVNMIKTIVSRVSSMTEVPLENVLAVCPSTVEFTAKDQTKEFSTVIRIYIDDIHNNYSSVFPALGITLKPRRGYGLRWTCRKSDGNRDTRSEHQEVIAPGKRRLMLSIYVR